MEYPKGYTRRELRTLRKLWDTPHSYKLLLEACETKGMVCSAGKNYIFIDNEGDVSPCQLFTKRMGNILSEPIAFQAEDTICPVPVCWCGNENQALRLLMRSMFVLILYECSRLRRAFLSGNCMKAIIDLFTARRREVVHL